MSAIIEYYKVNGLYVTISEVVSRLKSKVISKLIAMKLNNAGNLKISSNTYIRGLKYIRIGSSFYAGNRFWLEAISNHGVKKYTPRIVIKDNVSLNDDVHIAATNFIEIGHNVLMASKIYISDHNHGYYTGPNQTDPAVPPNEREVSCDSSVIIGDNVWIGEQVVILPGARIGAGCVVGANSVVSGIYPDNSIIVGSPAKTIKMYDEIKKEWVRT